MRHLVGITCVVATAALIGVGYLSHRVQRARREIGGEIQAATVVLSRRTPPPAAALRLVDDDERAII